MQSARVEVWKLSAEILSYDVLTYLNNLQIAAVEVSCAVDFERLVIGDVVALVLLGAHRLRGASACGPKGKRCGLEKSRSHL